jgi:hypothetical protein
MFSWIGNKVQSANDNGFDGWKFTITAFSRILGLLLITCSPNGGTEKK